MPLMALGGQLVVTHGNGPVVGKIHLRQAIARHRVTPMSLDICVAHSQGGIAYLLMQALENALRGTGNPRHVVCLLTQVEVDPDDPAFDNPTKPIGYFYNEEEAAALTAELGWRMVEDAGRGWRHVVPSPKPKHVVDISLVRALAEHGAVVIAGGGGGIPVTRAAGGIRHGIEAVIDKDLTSALMAKVLGVGELMILTAVARVAVHFNTPQQKELDKVTAPKPKHVVDISLVRALAEHGAVVIAGGGGGIPVTRAAGGIRHGIEAVIDKDLTSICSCRRSRMHCAEPAIRATSSAC